MTETAKMEVTQRFSIVPARPGKAYFVPCTEWDHLKSDIRELSDRPNLWVMVGCVFLGASLSSFITLCVGASAHVYPGEMSKTVILGALSAATFVIGVLMVCFGWLRSKDFKKRASGVVSQMQLIEERYADEPGTQTSASVSSISVPLELLPVEEYLKHPVYAIGEVTDIQANKSNDKTLPSRFLALPEGTVSIWVFVTEQMMSGRKHRYPLSHCPRGGIRNKLVNKYLNVFAFRIRGRETPEQSPIFTLWCSDGGGEETYIHHERALSEGWHLFSASWSRTDDFIKFYVDSVLVGAKKFEHWPEELATDCFVGTWPTRSAGHYVNSSVGPLRVYDKALGASAVAQIFDQGHGD